MKSTTRLLLGTLLSLAGAGATTLVGGVAAGAAPVELTSFGQAVAPSTGGCGFIGVAGGFSFDTGAPENGRFQLGDGTFHCRTTLQTPPPAKAVVASTAPFIGPCWDGSTFASATNWMLVITPSGQADYICHF